MPDHTNTVKDPEMNDAPRLTVEQQQRAENRRLREQVAALHARVEELQAANIRMYDDDRHGTCHHTVSTEPFGTPPAPTGRPTPLLLARSLPQMWRTRTGGA